MTYCIDFFRKFKKDGNFCGLDDSQVSRLTSYLEIVELLMKQKIPEEQIYKNFTVNAATPLIASKDEARTTGLNFVTSQLKEGKKVTNGDVQTTLKSCSTTTRQTERKPKLPVETEPKKEPVILHPELKPPNPYQPAPGSIPIIDAPPQPSLAQQMKAEDETAPEYLKKYPITAACLQSECGELHLQRSGLHICKLKGMRPENFSESQRPQVCRLVSLPEPGIIPAPKPAPCHGFHPREDFKISDQVLFKCPDGKSNITVEKVRGRVCKIIGVPVNQLPGGECPLEWKDRLAATKPGTLDQGNTAFSRAGELPKAETKWGSGKILTREEKMRVLCTQILIPKQVQVLKTLVKAGEADDELMALDVIIQEAAERMEV